MKENFLQQVRILADTIPKQELTCIEEQMYYSKHLSSPEEYLKGKNITHIEVNGGSGITFFDEAGYLCNFYCHADCCSEGWIEHIEGADNLTDCKILELTEIYGDTLREGDEGFSGRQQVDQIYFLKIKTTKGYADVDFRNSSNGYYGTILEWRARKES